MQSKKVFKDLAKKNVKKSAKDYFIYFFTLTAAVCLFYTFNSIGAQFAMLGIPDTFSFLDASKGAMIGVSVLVCIIVGFLVVYANRFMMKRRKREFGIYTVLGMRRKDISRILMKETIQIGTGSLVAGLLLGVGASQALSLITAKMAGITLTNFEFVLSGEAVLAAIVFFALTFACVHFFNVKEIKKIKLIDMLYADRKNEEVPEDKKGVLLTGLLSLVLIASGYVVIFLLGSKYFGLAVFGGGALIGVGTILFFLSAAGIAINILKKRKSFYYRKLNLFVVNQMGSRMKSSGLSIAIVCILMFLSVSVMGVGMGSGESMIAGKNQMAPYSVSIYRYNDEGNENQGQTIQGALKDDEILNYIQNRAEFNLYSLSGVTDNELFGKYAENKKEGLYYQDSTVGMISLEDLNRIRVLIGQEPVELGENEFAVVYNETTALNVLKRFAGEEQTVKIAGTSYHFRKGGLYQTTLYNRNTFLNGGILVVPQSVAETGNLEMRILNGMFDRNQDESDAVVDVSMQRHQDMVFASRADIFVEVMSNQLTASYIGTYLGITFLVTAGAVLALQQLTQTEDNKKRYALLRKMGAGNKMMKKSLMAQMMIFFGLPFLVAGIHSAVVMTGLYRNLLYLSPGSIARNILTAAGLAVVVYGVYFVTTYQGSKRILKL